MKVIKLKNQVDDSLNELMMTRQTKLNLTVLFLLVLIPGIVNAQQDTVLPVPDTSYFIQGEDDLNLLESVIMNSVENTTLLLDRGANPNTISTTGNSALMYASEKGNMAIMKLLVEYGAEVNTSGFRGETPLLLAIFNNDFQAAKYLLERGADPNVKDDFGVTPLIYASATNQYQSSDLLMFYEADESETDSEGNDPLLTAVTFEHLETTDVLLQNGLNPDVQDNEGNTPAIVATQHGRYDLLELLIEYKADVNIPNKKRYTPLAYALTYNDVQASGILINAGADVNHEVDKGVNMAELARITGNDSLINLINEKGGKIPPGIDLSEFQFSFSNSFNSTDYLIGFRFGMADPKHGYYFETGVDYRPFLLRVQTSSDDTIYQFRERRIGWSHSIGKYFNLYRSSGGLNLFAYGSVTGFLSFPQYQGTSEGPGTGYSIIPSAGVGISGRYVGLKAGADWYNFESTLDKGLKFNLSLIFRISYPKKHYDRKEIYWE